MKHFFSTLILLTLPLWASANTKPLEITVCADYGQGLERMTFQWKKNLKEVHFSANGNPTVTYPEIDSRLIGETVKENHSLLTGANIVWGQEVAVELENGRPLIFIADRSAAGEDFLIIVNRIPLVMGRSGFCP